jgi:hypothetical protein
MTADDDASRRTHPLEGRAMTATLPAPLPVPTSESRRTAQRGWSLYDVANSAFMTTLVAAIAGPYLLALTNAGAQPSDPTGKRSSPSPASAVAPAPSSPT